MTSFTLPDFACGLPAAQVDASLRQALSACDRAQECAVLWFAEVQRRGLHRLLGHASLQLYATVGLGFSDNRYGLFKRLADDLDRLPVLREAVASGAIGWTKARQVARVATVETSAEWVARAATTGRRELEMQVRQARMWQSVAQRFLVEAPLRPASDPPVTINLRADGLQLARFEALVEKAHRLGLAPAGADRMDLMLAALESMVGGGAADRPHATGPAAQIIVHQCPDCACAAVTTNRGERRLAPAQVQALACDARVSEQGKPNRDHQALGARRRAGARPPSLCDARVSIDAFPRSPSRETAKTGRVEPGGEPGHVVQPVPCVRA